MKAAGYIVVFDDDMGITVPMRHGMDCSSSLEAWSGKGPVALFATRAEARRAIRISAAWARLLKAQGRAHSEDFSPENRRCIKVIQLEQR